MKLPSFFSEPNPAELERVAAVLADQGLLKKEYVVDEHLLTP